MKQQCCRICTLTILIPSKADGLELTEVIPNVGDDNNISEQDISGTCIINCWCQINNVHVYIGCDVWRRWSKQDNYTQSGTPVNYGTVSNALST